MKIFLVMILLQGNNMTVVEKVEQTNKSHCEITMSLLRAKDNSALLNKVRASGQTPVYGCVEEWK